MKNITISLTPKEAELVWIAIEDLQRSCEAAVEADTVEALDVVCRKLIKSSQGEE